MRSPKFAFVFLSVFLALQVLPAGSQQNGPPVVIDPTTYDFGDIESGTPVETTFTFTNTGSEPIGISDIRPSCGCTSVRWTQGAIKPGASGSINVEMNTSRLIGPQREVIAIDISGWNVRDMLKTYRVQMNGTVKSGKKK